MKRILCVFIVFSMVGCKNELNRTQLIRDYSDQPTRKYSLEEWQDLGFDVWKEYYDSKRWETITKNSHIISEYITGTELRLKYLLEQAQREGISIDKTNIEILVRPLDERIVPVHNWFWFPRRERVLMGAYEITYNSFSLGSTLVNLPATVE